MHNTPQRFTLSSYLTLEWANSDSSRLRGSSGTKPPSSSWAHQQRVLCKQTCLEVQRRNILAFRQQKLQQQPRQHPMCVRACMQRRSALPAPHHPLAPYPLLPFPRYMAMWIGLSGTVIMINKYILDPTLGGFPYPLTLGAAHMMFCSLLSGLLVKLGLVEVTPVPNHVYVR